MIAAQDSMPIWVMIPFAVFLGAATIMVILLAVVIWRDR